MHHTITDPHIVPYYGRLVLTTHESSLMSWAGWSVCADHWYLLLDYLPHGSVLKNLGMITEYQAVKVGVLMNAMCEVYFTASSQIGCEIAGAVAILHQRGTHGDLGKCMGM